MAKDFYKILGVDKGASDEDIKKAYRKLAHEHHPDKASGNEAKFKEINEAYQMLGNKEKRSQYDRFGSAYDGAGGGAGGPFGGFNFDPSQFGDLGDIFGDIFGGFGFGGGGRAKHASTRGSDLEMRLELTLEEAFTGLKKNIQINTLIKCTTCNGVGHFTKDGFDTCSACDGRGEVRETKRSIFGTFAHAVQCSRCSGMGKIPKKICTTCRGLGRIKSERGLDINIPPGITDGQIIKITGSGEAGERGSQSGDLYVGVRVKPHSIFTRVGNDLVIKREVLLLDVLLDNPIKIRTISGRDIEVRVPADFNIKNKIEIEGAGMPRFDSYGHGNLYLDLDIKTPKKLTPEVKKLLEELKGEL